MNIQNKAALTDGAPGITAAPPLEITLTKDNLDILIDTPHVRIVRIHQPREVKAAVRKHRAPSAILVRITESTGSASFASSFFESMQPGEEETIMGVARGYFMLLSKRERLSRERDPFRYSSMNRRKKAPYQRLRRLDDSVWRLVPKLPNSSAKKAALVAEGAILSRYFQGYTRWPRRFKRYLKPGSAMEGIVQALRNGGDPANSIVMGMASVLKPEKAVQAMSEAISLAERRHKGSMSTLVHDQQGGLASAVAGVVFLSELLKSPERSEEAMSFLSGPLPTRITQHLLSLGVDIDTADVLLAACSMQATKPLDGIARKITLHYLAEDFPVHLLPAGLLDADFVVRLACRAAGNRSGREEHSKQLVTRFVRKVQVARKARGLGRVPTGRIVGRITEELQKIEPRRES